MSLRPVVYKKFMLEHTIIKQAWGGSGPLSLIIVVPRFNSWDHSFFTFFKTSQNLGSGVRDSIMAMIMVRFTFEVYYISTNPNCTLLVHYRWHINKVSNINIHRRTCSHCHKISYLNTIPFAAKLSYGRIVLNSNKFWFWFTCFQHNPSWNINEIHSILRISCSN